MSQEAPYESPKLEELDTGQGPVETAAGPSGPD